MSRILVVALCAFLMACGGESPTAPSAPSPTPTPAPMPVVANIAGTWTGHVEATHPDVGVTYYRVVMTLTQAGEQINGSYRQEPDSGANLRGTVSGTLSGVGSDTSFTGTTTWDARSGDPAIRCTASAAVRGPATRVPMTWTSDDVSFQQCSGVLTDVRWVLTKE